MVRRAALRLGAGLVGILSLTGCLGDPPPDPAEAPIEVVLDTGAGEDKFCTLNRDSVAPGRHELSIVGEGEVRVSDAEGEQVLIATGSALSEPKDPEIFQTRDTTYTPDLHRWHADRVGAADFSGSMSRMGRSGRGMAELRAPLRVSRRRWLALAGTLTGTVGLAGCAADEEDAMRSPSTPRGEVPDDTGASTSAAAPTQDDPSRTLLIYFSRAGENFDRDGEQTSGNGRPISVLEVGNTEVVAGVITQLLRCEQFRIEPVDPYPADYAQTVIQNVAEQERQARPAIVDPLTGLDRWDTILIGSPVWGSQAPRIMLTLLEALDFTDKTVAVFTTHAGSGLAGIPQEYQAACRGTPTFTDGLAIRGEESAQCRPAVTGWLRSIGLLAS